MRKNNKFLAIIMSLVFLLTFINPVGVSAGTSINLHLDGFSSTSVQVGLYDPVTEQVLTVFGSSSSIPGMDGYFEMSTNNNTLFKLADNGAYHTVMITAFIIGGDVYQINPVKDPRVVVGEEGNLGNGTNNYWIDGTATAPSITLDKQADSGPYLPGDTVNYTLTVANAGDGEAHDLYDVHIVDNDIDYTSENIILASTDDPHVFNASFIIPLDYEGETFTNTATVYGTYGVQGVFETTIEDDDSVIVDVIQFIADPSITIDKSTDVGPYEVGDTVTYTVTVTNTGNVELDDVTITDPLTGTNVNVGTLTADGGTATIHPTYIVLEGDMEVGQVDNKASVTGDYEGTPYTQSDDATVFVADTASLDINKTVTPDTGVQGDIVTYTIVVTNDGDVTLHDVNVIDAMLGVDETYLTLAPGASETVILNQPYTLTQDDVAAGHVTNIATASALYTYNNEPASLLVSDNAVVTTIAGAGISIIKTADKDEYEVGDIVTFTITVDNVGNVDLTNVNVDDTLLGVVFADGYIGDLAHDADPVELTATYVVTAADLTTGSVLNTVLTSGRYADGEGSVEDSTEKRVTIIDPSIMVEKVARDRLYIVGDTVVYDITVTNNGTVPLTDIMLTDDLTGDTKHIASLAVGATDTMVVSYVVQESDFNPLTENGMITNTVSAVGLYKSFEAIDTDDEDVWVRGIPAIEVVKTPSVLSAIEGETYSYHIEVFNRGTVTLTNVIVDDDLLMIHEIVGTLPVGESEVITGSALYTVTHDDFLVGKVTNLASAAGLYMDMFENSYPVEDTDEVITPIMGSPAITLDKEVLNSIGDTFGETSIADSGDEITYRFTVENTGNVDLTEVTIDDPLIAETLVIGLLTPGEIQVREVTFTILDVNFIDGVFQNTADVVGQYGDTTVYDNDNATVTRNNTPAIAIDKTADKQSGTVGTVIEYTIIVTNVGTVPLTNVYVEDQGTMYGPYDLAQGESMEIAPKPEHTITLNDVLQGSYTNIATASGLYIEQTVSAKDDAIVDTYALPAITINKQVSSNSVYVGDTVTYSVTVTNTGNVALSDVVVSDPMFDVAGKIGEISELAVGDSYLVDGLTFTTTAVGTINNTATVVAWDYTSSENRLEETDSESVTVSNRPIIVQNNPSISVSIAPDGTLVLLGTDVTFTMVVRNTGNTILNGVTLTNTSLGFSETLTDVLYVGQTRTFTVVKTMDDLNTFNTDVDVTGLSPQLVTVVDDAVTLVNVYEENEEEVPEEPTPGANPETGAIPLGLLGIVSLLSLGAGVTFFGKRKEDDEE